MSLRGKRTLRERARRLPALLLDQGPPPDQGYLPLGRSTSQKKLRGERVAMMSSADLEAERIRLLSLVDIFEPLSKLEIEHLSGQLRDTHLERGEMS